MKCSFQLHLIVFISRTLFVSQKANKWTTSHDFLHGKLPSFANDTHFANCCQLSWTLTTPSPVCLFKTVNMPLPVQQRIFPEKQLPGRLYQATATQHAQKYKQIVCDVHCDRSGVSAGWFSYCTQMNRNLPGSREKQVFGKSLTAMYSHVFCSKLAETWNKHCFLGLTIIGTLLAVAVSDNLVSLRVSRLFYFSGDSARSSWGITAS